MIKNIKDALLGLLLLISTPVFSQHRLTNGLEVGERVPDIVLEHYYDQPNKKVKLSSIKKQVIILDFWNIWCSACIASFPKLDSLQKEFGDRIEIILVTNNSQNEVKKIFSKPILKNISLPIITSDNKLSRLFPYEGVPHNVWINNKGMVEYITYGYNTTRKHITEYLSGNKPILSYKKEDVALDFTKPLWAKENFPFERNIQYYSYFSGWLSEYGGGGKLRVKDSISDRIGIRFINEPLLSLCQIAFGGMDGGDFIYSNRLILDVPDPNTLFGPKNEDEQDQWGINNFFCYEVVVPTSKQSELFPIMQQDLNRYLNYSVNIEKRLIKCLSLIRTSNKDKLRSENTLNKVVQSDSSLLLEGVSFTIGLIRRLKIANENIKTPIIDETGYTENINIKIDCALSDTASLKKELRKYDLDLVLKEKEIEMLVIKPKTRDGRHHRF